MKKFIVRLLPLLLIALVFAGCSSTPKLEEGDGMGAAGAEVSDRSAGDAATAGAAAAGAWTGSPLDDPSSLLYTKTIYFEFDRSEIRSEYVEMLRAHADYLANNPNAVLNLEGHCDERGTREYNLGLGERRANAVMNFMLAEGVARSQISTISYGEERPVDTGHSETAWSQNRRVELVY